MVSALTSSMICGDTVCDKQKGAPQTEVIIINIIIYKCDIARVTVIFIKYFKILVAKQQKTSKHQPPEYWIPMSNGNLGASVALVIRQKRQMLLDKMMENTNPYR